MQGNTHIVGGGITASLAFAQFSNDNPLVLVGAGGVIGALLPDICHRGSKIGRTFPPHREASDYSIWTPFLYT